VKRQLGDLLEQLPPSGPGRAFVLVALAVGSLVAISVPIFFAIMLVEMLRR
jgi:hypothetical protein